MPPENSCGYWRTRASGLPMRTARSRSTARCARRRLRQPVVHLGHLAELPADAQRRVERRHRILVDDRERAAEQPPPLARRRGRAGPAPKQRRGARRHPRARPAAGLRSPSRSASCRSPTRRRCRRSRPARPSSETPAHRRPTRPGTTTVEVLDGEHGRRRRSRLPSPAVGSRGRRGVGAPSSRRGAAARGALGERLAEERERQRGER